MILNYTLIYKLTHEVCYEYHKLVIIFISISFDIVKLINFITYIYKIMY